MKKICVIFSFLCLLIMTAYSEDGSSDRINSLILEELKGIRASLERLADEIADYRKEEKETSESQSFSMCGPSFSSRGPDISALAKITFPENPSQENIKKYITDIMAASRNQNSFSDRDPQISMLMKVGSENIPILIDCLLYGRISGNYHINLVITSLADEKNKSVILDALPINQNLISAVIEKGWEKDARDILIWGLKAPAHYLPTEWIQAAANLKDPESYPLLREYFIRGPNPSHTYKAIKYLPIEDMPGAVDEAWRLSKYKSGYSAVSMALIAVEYGHIDALGVLIDSLAYESREYHWMTSQIRAALWRYTDFRGSNDELKSWFDENRENLSFNSETKKFMVDKEE